MFTRHFVKQASGECAACREVFLGAKTATNEQFAEAADTRINYTNPQFQDRDGWILSDSVGI